MPTTETRRLNPLLLMGIVLAAAALGIYGIRALTRDVVEVRVSPVTRQNMITQAPTNGRVEPILFFQAHALAPGVVKKIHVSVGQRVNKGDLLLQMDDADARARLAAARAATSAAESNLHDLQQGGSRQERIALSGDLSRAELQQQQAAKDLAALQQLQQKGAASAGEVAAAEHQLQAAQATVENLSSRKAQPFSSQEMAKAQAQLVDARAAEAAARAALDGVNIRSPLAGTVYAIPVSTFDFVPEGEALMSVADLNHIQVRAYFDEPEIGRLAAGQAATIEWEARPGQTWHGHVSQVPTTVITYGTRNVGECIVTVDDAHEDLLPNTNVTVRVTVSQRFNALGVPREALHTEGANDFVFRVVDGRLARTPVRVGIVNVTRAEILSGLTEGDVVALQATTNRELTNGLAVKVAE